MSKNKQQKEEKVENDPTKEQQSGVPTGAVQENEYEKLGALIYYKIHGTKILFTSLPEAERKGWEEIAEAARIGLDQMGLSVVPYKAPQEVEANKMKNIDIITGIIENFVKKLNILKCPQCGKSDKVKLGLFPCRELAHKIWGD